MAEALLRRAQELRRELQADVREPEVAASRSRSPLVELELLLAEDPLRGVEKELEEVEVPVEVPVEPAERREKVEMTVEKTVEKVEKLEKLELDDFDHLSVELKDLELTQQGLRKMRDSEPWLRLRLPLGSEKAEELLLRCRAERRASLGHAARHEKQPSASWRILAERRIEVGLLKGKGSGSGLVAVAEVELPWFAVLLDPGSACPFVAEWRVVETGKSILLGRLHFSMQLFRNSPPAEASATPVHLRLWLLRLEGFSSARAVLKLGTSQELAVEVVEGALSCGLVSRQCFWRGAGPAWPGCVFVQLWRGAELLGLAKVGLPELMQEAVEELEAVGCLKLLEEEVPIVSVSQQPLGQLRLLVHAGLPATLEALVPAPAPEVLTQALLRVSLEETLEGAEAEALASWSREARETAVAAVQQGFDDLVKEVADCAQLSSDLLDVAAPAWLQREDLARAFRFRGTELPWRAVEAVYEALQAPRLPSPLVARLLAARGAVRVARRARQRARAEEAREAWRAEHSAVEAARLVSAYSKSDGTLDLLGLRVLLGSLAAEEVAPWLFEELGGREGLTAQRLRSWLAPELREQPRDPKEELKEEPNDKPKDKELKEKELQEEAKEANVPLPQLPQILEKPTRPSLPKLPVPSAPSPVPSPVPSPRASPTSPRLACASWRLARPLEDAAQLQELLAQSLALPAHRVEVHGLGAKVCVKMPEEALRRLLRTWQASPLAAYLT